MTTRNSQEVTVRLRPDDVLGKTQRGVAEFTSSRRALPQKLRNALLLVDGRRRVGDLLTLDPEAGGHLEALFRAGFVGIVPARQRQADDGAAARRPVPVREARAQAEGLPAQALGALPAPAAGATPLETLRLVATGQLLALAGNEAEPMVRRLRRCARIGELRVELQRTADLLDRFVGPDAARAFGDRMAREVQGIAL